MTEPPGERVVSVVRLEDGRWAMHNERNTSDVTLDDLARDHRRVQALGGPALATAGRAAVTTHDPDNWPLVLHPVAPTSLKPKPKPKPRPK